MFPWEKRPQFVNIAQIFQKKNLESKLVLSTTFFDLTNNQFWSTVSQVSSCFLNITENMCKHSWLLTENWAGSTSNWEGRQHEEGHKNLAKLTERTNVHAATGHISAFITTRNHNHGYAEISSPWQLQDHYNMLSLCIRLKILRK